jgi:hypothetical protein
VGWRKLEDTFLDHPKFKRLGRALPSIDEMPQNDLRVLVAKALVANLWTCALRYAPDGEIKIDSWPDICELIGWPDDPQILLDSMQNAGFLDREDNIIMIRNWAQRGGTYVENLKRAQRRKRSADVRGQSRTSADKAGCPRMSALDKSRVEEKEDSIVIPANADASAAESKSSTNRIEPDPTPDVTVTSPVKPASAVQDIWQHYRTHHPGTAKVLRSSRAEYRLIKARLEDFTVDQLKAAIDGYHRSPWHTGENPQSKTYLALTLIMRDVSHVQSGLEFMTPKKRNLGRPLDLGGLAGDTGVEGRT